MTFRRLNTHSRCLLMLAIAIAFFLAGRAYAQPIQLDGIKPARVIGQSVYVIADHDGVMSFETAQSMFRDGQFERSSQKNLDFGYTQTVNWVAIPIENTSSVSVTYLLSTNWPFIHSLNAVLVIKGREPQTILDRKPDTPYQAERRSGMSLASEQFLIPPRSEATIFARFEPFAFGILPISLETPTTAYQRAVLDNWGFAIFYSAVLAAAFIFMLFVVAVRHAGGLYFMGIIVSGILIIAQLDGFFFAYLWPEWPLWDRVAPFHFLIFVNFTSFALAAYMFREASMNRLSKLAHNLMFASLLPVPAQLIINIHWLIIIGYIFLVAAMAALFYAIVVWTQILPRKRQIAFLLSIGMLGIVGAIVWSVMAGFDAINLASHNLIKLLYSVMVLSCMIAYATHIAALNRNFAASLQRQLELARKEADTNAELLKSERKFAEAQELVAKHKHRLATTSHDLKQPIASLRLTLDAMAKSGGKEVEANVARAFDYLEDLVNENLFEAAGNEDTPEPGSGELNEAIELDLLFETVRQMFNEEAISKGIALETRPAEVTLKTQIVPFMRIVSNLVSNSVKHTSTGTVSIYAEDSESSVEIVIADTGPGMSRDEIERFSTRYEKSETSSGTGLGLPICFDLAKELGLELAITSKIGKGSEFRLSVPDTLINNRN